MDFSQIKYFLALCETLNFTGAANKCNVTQPTLTQAIKRLEDELSGQLVIRDGKKTRLTPLGKMLRLQFEKIDETRKLIGKTAAYAAADGAPPLNIAVMHSIGPGLISSFLENFRNCTTNPLVCLYDASTKTIDDMLLSGEIDAAFCTRYRSKNLHLDYLHLLDERMVVAFKNDHAFANLESIPLKNLAHEPYLDRTHCEFRQELVAETRRQNIELPVAFSSERDDWIQHMIAEKFGVSIVPENSISLTDIESRPLSQPNLSRGVELVMPQDWAENSTQRALMTTASKWAW